MYFILKHQLLSLVAGLGFVLSSGALSQPVVLPSDPTSKLTVSHIDTSDDKAAPKLAASAKPGDVLEYSASYFNGGKAAVERVQAVVPVPPGTILLANSAKPANPQATVDGINFSATPLKRTVKLPDGKSREELVPLSEYRALRWPIGTIAASQNMVVSLRVQIVQTLGPDLAKL